MDTDSAYQTRYYVRVPFPDADLFCFVLDNQGNVAYYFNKADAQAEAAKYQNAVILESKHHG